MLNKTWPAALLAALPLISAAQTTVQDCQEAMRHGDFTAAARHGREAGGYDGLMCAGRAQLALSDYASAASTFAALETSAREPFQQAVVAIFRARCARGLGRVEEALAHYERSLTLARSLQYKQAVMTALNESGQLLQAGGDVQGALARFREAYDHAANDNERAECHHLIAFAHSALGNHDKAIEHQLKSVVL
ncbi:MAG: tetratricopeptide repeat protein, partial [Methylophilaceae bacterium]|nr:tetratricopeptide repeat protein [Methylophilaceae bacterium]